MIVCPSCNARNANRSTFCIRCGGGLSSPAERDPAGHTDALAVQPEHTPAGLIDLAATQLAEGQSAPAVENCRRAIALSPGEVEAHAILGMAYEQAGDLAAALEAYETVVLLAPERNVERQKAALLRLRLGDHPAPVATASRPHRESTFWPDLVARVHAQVAKNPPVYAGVASGVAMLLILTIIVSCAGRASHRRQVQAQYQGEVALADQALTEQRYAEAVAHYAAAYRLKPGDEALRQNWQRAYELSQQPSGDPEALRIAQLPKYIPNPGGTNPFAPVPIGGYAGQGVPVPLAPTPEQAATAPPPTVTSHPPTQFQPVRDEVRTLPPPTAPTLPGGRAGRPLPSPFGVKQPITPVPERVTKPATTTPPPAVDNTHRGPAGDITIWASDTPAPRPTAAARPAAVSNEAETLRAQGESAAAAGNVQEAISRLQSATSAFDERAQRDPGSAAISRQAAASCRARIEVLRKGQ